MRTQEPVGQSVGYRKQTLLPKTVVLQIMGDKGIAAQYEIPAMGWEAFKRIAKRRKVEPINWLVVLLGKARASGLSVGEMLKWLFPAKSPEIRHFEAAQRRFHGRVE